MSATPRDSEDSELAVTAKAYAEIALGLFLVCVVIPLDEFFRRLFRHLRFTRNKR
jgi:hypothetical protein